MKPRDKTIIDLTYAGYVFIRHGGNHDIYKNPETGHMIPLKRHDFDEADRRYINKEIRQGGKKKS